MPSRSAAILAGGATSFRPRPAGASGRVSRALISCFAARRSRTSAPNGAVAATAIRATSASAENGLRPELESAARRDSSSVRSMMRTPSRWSSSCWTIRDDGSASSSTTGSPSASRPSIVTVAGTFHGHEHLAQREAAFVVDARLARALRDHRVDEHAVLALVRRTRRCAAGRRPGSPRARRPGPRA